MTALTHTESLLTNLDYKVVVWSMRYEYTRGSILAILENNSLVTDKIWNMLEDEYLHGYVLDALESDTATVGYGIGRTVVDAINHLEENLKTHTNNHPPEEAFLLDVAERSGFSNARKIAITTLK